MDKHRRHFKKYVYLKKTNSLESKKKNNLNLIFVKSNYLQIIKSLFKTYKLS